MKLIKIVLLVTIFCSLSFGQEKININFKDLKIMELVKITSKIIDKNILVTQNIKGKVDFISNKPLDKDEIVKVLIYVLESKGYTLVQSDDIMRIIKLNESARKNVPVISSKKDKSYYQMVTEVLPVYNVNVDYITSKVRQLSPRTGKLVTNKDSNSFVLTDFKDNIKTVRKVVSIMTTGAKKSTAIVNLKNIKAADAKKNLDAIAKSKFNAKIETQKVAVIANKDNNSVILIGNTSNISYLKNYIKSVDLNDSLVKRVVKVLPLKNVEAKNVIKIIDGIIGKKKYIDPNDKPLSSVDEETNSIVLMGPSNEIEYINALIKELDKEKAQVYVQARIIEVNDEKLDEVGVQYGVLGGKVSSNGLGAFSANLNGGSNAVQQVVSGLGLEIPNITSGLALGASISLLNENGALDIVSEPSVLAINNKESSIYVGETISIKTSSTTTDGGNTNDNYSREDVGLTLKVKPRISNDNKVTLEINTILEDVKTTATTSGNADTTKKEVKTTAIVNNGEPVILGGLIEDIEENTIQKVPVLGDLPLLGPLFSHDKKTLRKKSLVIIVTPYIIPQSKDLSYVRNQLAELKLLEDRFLKNSLVRLKKKQIKELKEKKEHKKKLEALEKEFKEASKEVKKIQVSSNKKTSTEEHQQRVNEILGM